MPYSAYFEGAQLLSYLPKSLLADAADIELCLSPFFGEAHFGEFHRDSCWVIEAADPEHYH